MNWKQAMAAMVDGQKVRFIEWHPARWVSAENSDSMGSYTFEELQTMEWEVYKEQTNTHDDVLRIVDDFHSKARTAMYNIFDKFLEDIARKIYDEHSTGREDVMKIFKTSNNLVRQDLYGIYSEAIDELLKLKIR